MSNTSTVSVYDDTYVNDDVSSSASSGTRQASGPGACERAARWLLQDTEADRKVRAGHRAARRRDLTRAPLAERRVVAVPLRIRDSSALAVTAERLGYRRVEPTVVASSAAPATERVVLLEHQTTGERLAIRDRASGRVAVDTVGSKSSVHKLVREHVTVCATKHLESRGYSVAAKHLVNGELQLEARERSGTQAGQQALVRAVVTRDGTTAVDIDCVSGSRCETIAAGLAEAVGGELSAMRKKSEYWQMPGEAAVQNRNRIR